MARYILARVENGDGGEYLHYMLLPDGQWHQITRFSDGTSDAAFGPDGTLYLLSRKDAPMGKVRGACASYFLGGECENRSHRHAFFHRWIRRSGLASIRALIWQAARRS